MKTVAITSEHFAVEFESEDELRIEYANNISAGGLLIPTSTELQPFSPMQLTLKLIDAGEAQISATVVQVMASAFAVAFDIKPDEILAALLSKPAVNQTSSTPAESNTWDRIRNLSRVEKLLLAPKADRSERTVLLQDNDAQVLYSLLKNPRITTEEVVRIARSPLLATATADLIAKTTIWASNSEIRSALVHNPRTPTPLALKLLPTLPEPEIRQIAKSSAVSQALKQAALRIVINRN
ncbi:MAG: PilZ domain-containing protein [Acidobacteriota bacterium]